MQSHNVALSMYFVITDMLEFGLLDGKLVDFMAILIIFAKLSLIGFFSADKNLIQLTRTESSLLGLNQVY
jgi:hypothetical protein